MKQVSRRDFLKHAAVGAVGMSVLGAGALAEEKDARVIYNNPAQWDHECDVAVIGSGTSMYGMVKLAKAGVDVICVEAFPITGGSTALSGGCAWMPVNADSVPYGDTREKAFTYMKKNASESYTTDELVAAYVDTVHPMLDFINPELEAHPLCLKPLVYHMDDYNPTWEGACKARVMMWPATSPDATDAQKADIARTWSDATLEIAKNYGARIMTSTKMTKFVYRYDDAGVPEVLGIICEQGGKEIAIKAKKAVIFAPGGFEWNLDLQKMFSAIVVEYPCSLSTCDGTALKAAMVLGPQLANMQNHFGQITYKEKAADQHAKGAPAPLNNGARSCPHACFVNQYGRRFCNEDVNYDTLQEVFYNRRTDGGEGVENLPAWMIVDQRFIDAGYSSTMYEFFVGPTDENGVLPYFHKADSIEEIADMFGINKENLLETIAAFNAYAANGKDEDFNRAAATMGTIEQGPFYAAELAPSTLGTCGGPLINPKGQVMHATGTKINRLYACGNASGFGGPGDGYCGGGGTIGPGLIFGYLSACTIINEENEWA